MEELAALQVAAHHEQHSLNRVAFSSYLQCENSIRRKKVMCMKYLKGRRVSEFIVIGYYYFSFGKDEGFHSVTYVP